MELLISDCNSSLVVIGIWCSRASGTGEGMGGSGCLLLRKCQRVVVYWGLLFAVDREQKMGYCRGVEGCSSNQMQPVGAHSCGVCQKSGLVGY